MITVDSRAGSGDMVPMFPPGMAVVGSLEYGDFFFLGNGPDDSMVSICVERKALKDLLNSMVTGRLSGHQLPGLVQTYEYNYILVEGVWRFNPDSGVLESLNNGIWYSVCLGERRFMAKEVVAFLNTLDVKAGMHLLYSHSKRESVQIITALYQWWNAKQWDEHTSHLNPSKSFKGPKGEVMLIKPSLVRRIAAEMPLVGWGKSRSVAEFFPSVLAMCLADENIWMKIDGIGKGIASKVVEAIRHNYHDREKGE